MNETLAKHGGNLDDHEIADTHAEVWLAQEGVRIEVYSEGGSVYLNARQALSLLAYLEQEKPTLEQLAKGIPQ